MNKPKMILFDYGHTLVEEPGWDESRARRELMKYITKNPRGCTLEDIEKVTGLIYENELEAIHEMGYEVAGQATDRVLFESLGIEHSLTPVERETVFWDGASAGRIMEGVDEVLDYLAGKNIRTGVISNLIWSGEALEIRLNRLLPNHHFEFFMTSCDYLFRKPHPMMFNIALQKAGLSGEEVWYCGDNPQADVEGSAQAGIFPVWYESPLECAYRDKTKETPPKCECLHIHRWSEMIELFESAK